MKITTNQVVSLSQETYGLVPPLVNDLLHISPEVAYNYIAGLAVLKESSLTPLQQHAIQLKISLLNQCSSCVKGHSFLAKQQGLSDEDLLAIQHNLLTTNASLNRLLAITELLFTGSRTGFTPALLEKLNNAAATPKEILEIIGLLSLKLISNSFSNYSKAAKAYAILATH